MCLRVGRSILDRLGQQSKAILALTVSCSLSAAVGWYRPQFYGLRRNDSKELILVSLGDFATRGRGTRLNRTFAAEWSYLVLGWAVSVVLEAGTRRSAGSLWTKLARCSPCLLGDVRGWH